MDAIGLFKKFSVNRPLTEEERKEQLHQNTFTEGSPLPRKAIIQMNSTTLVICDKFFFDRGQGTAFGGFFTVFLPCVFIYCLIITTVQGRWQDAGSLFFLGVAAICSYVMIYASLRLVLRESFSYTHYPICFNRKTRQVHVFRLDGSVMTESWDKLFFTPGEKHILGTRDIRGHRLAEDGQTVLETFALPYYAYPESPNFYGMWEFVRQYMENKTAPEYLAPKVTDLLGVDKKRLDYGQALKLIHDYDSELVIPWIAWISFPVTMLYVAGRWFADRTSKIPQWPPEIAVELVPDANDPYVVNEESMKKAREKMTASPS